MTYHILPDVRDLDEEGVQKVVQFCQANGLDPTKIPAPAGDPGFALQFHGTTIRWREYVLDHLGRVPLESDEPRYTEWGERPLVAPAFQFGLSLTRVRA